MKTDDLIELLVKDLAPWRFRSILAGAVAGGIIIAAILFFVGIGFRPDISEAVKSNRFLFKFVVTVSLAVTAIWVTLSVGRPGGSLAHRGLALAIAPALLACAAVVELLVLPENQWMPHLVGHNVRFCLTLIPLLSIGPLACLLAALREGAPSSPGLAGAVAGLAASGIAATFYAANCTDDSALFVMTWYPIATLIVTTAGYLIGRKLLPAKWLSVSSVVAGRTDPNRGEAAPVLCRDSGCVVSSRDSHLRGERRAQLAALLAASSTVLRLAAPLVDLLVRLSLAKAFFAPGMLPSSHLFVQTSWPTIIVQLAGPVLLAAGLWVRPVALLMLVLTLLARTSGPAQDEHLFWAALFGWYVAQGAGPLSLDHLLGKGLGFSPLPLAGRAMAAADWFDRWVGPLYRLAVRLWLAAALAGDALALAMLPAAASVMLPATASAMLPRPWALLAAALLGAGLGTPLVAAGLLVAGTSMAMAGTDHAMTVYAPLLLALLGVSGAGRYSLDFLIAARMRRPAPPVDDAPHIVIVGAGFGGMACAAGLRRERARVTLIDRHNYHLFQPLLYQVATAGLSPADIAIPVRGVFRDHPSVRVLCGQVSGVDIANRCITVDGRRLPYDVLVLATGASHGYFGHEEWAAAAPGLKSVNDATSIRSRILAAFEQAEATDDPVVRDTLLTFLICGAGPTGVELAGAIAELARHGMEKEFRNFDPASVRILLVQAGPRVLPQFSERLSAFARASLEALGVEVRVNSRVEAIDAEGVVVNGERIAAATVLWAAGVVASPAAAWLGQEPDKAGRIKVGPDLSVPGLPNVFAIGDTALALAWDGQAAPGLAPAAKQAGAYVALVLRARLRGSRPPQPFRYRHQGSLATIGRKSAVADFGRVKLTGALAWWLWGAVHILFLAGRRNQFSVILGWVWSYFTFDVGVRLITGDGRPSISAPARASALSQ